MSKDTKNHYPSENNEESYICYKWRDEKEKKLISLIPEFKQLISLQERLDFKDKYSDLFEYMIGKAHQLENGDYAFNFLPDDNNKQDISLYNEWFINKIVNNLKQQATNSNTLPYATLEYLIQDYNERLKEIKNQNISEEEFALSEINRIEALFKNVFVDVFKKLYQQKINGRKRDLSKKLDINTLFSVLWVEPYVNYIFFLKAQKAEKSFEDKKEINTISSSHPTVYQLPENFELKMLTKLNLSSKLTIPQTAILFDYLIKHKAIINYSPNSLEKPLQLLTGHDGSNIRKRGFNNLKNIKNQEENIVAIKDLLTNILKDLDKDLKDLQNKGMP